METDEQDVERPKMSEAAMQSAHLLQVTGVAVDYSLDTVLAGFPPGHRIHSDLAALLAAARAEAAASEREACAKVADEHKCAWSVEHRGFHRHDDPGYERAAARIAAAIRVRGPAPATGAQGAKAPCLGCESREQAWRVERAELTAVKLRLAACERERDRKTEQAREECGWRMEADTRLHAALRELAAARALAERRGKALEPFAEMAGTTVVGGGDFYLVAARDRGGWPFPPRVFDEARAALADAPGETGGSRRNPDERHEAEGNAVEQNAIPQPAVVGGDSAAEARAADGRHEGTREAAPRRPLTKVRAEEIEAEMRRLESDPTVSKRALRLFMQAPMDCGHATGELMTCADPPFGCAACLAKSQQSAPGREQAVKEEACSSGSGAGSPTASTTPDSLWAGTSSGPVGYAAASGSPAADRAPREARPGAGAEVCRECSVGAHYACRANCLSDPPPKCGCEAQGHAPPAEAKPERALSERLERATPGWGLAGGGSLLNAIRDLERQLAEARETSDLRHAVGRQWRERAERAEASLAEAQETATRLRMMRLAAEAKLAAVRAAMGREE